MPSWQRPTAQEISRIAYLAARPEEQRYFFTRLENPLWIDELYKTGNLDPPAQVTVEGGTSNPPWPLSEYIARVAGNHPDQEFVARLLAELSRTDNVWVRRDLIAAMTSLDPHVITDLLPTVAEWVSGTGSVSWMLDRVGDLATHALRHSGNAEHVETILDAYLKPQWQEPDEQPPTSLRLDHLDEGDFAQRSLPALVELSGLLVLRVIMRNLGMVLERKNRDVREVAGVRDDDSIWWIADLSDGEHLGGADEVLAYLAAQTVDAITASAPQLAAGALELLDSGGWVIHQRLSLRLLSRCTAVESLHSEISRRLTDPALVSPLQTRREYQELLRSRFGEAEAAERDSILATLSAAADGKGDASDVWLYERLAAISDHLDGEWAERFEGYAELFGAPRELGPPLSVRWLPSSTRSPLEAGEAETMSAAGLAAFARNWALPEDEDPWERPNWRGLAEDIKAQVKARPSEFSAAAELFADANRTVVDAVLGGLKDSVREGGSIDWGPTLGLIKTIAPKDETRDENYDLSIEQDSSWSGAKSEALDLIQAGLGSEELLPQDLGSLVWETIELLAVHGAARDHIDFDETRDAVFVALNATRSRAVYTAMAYLSWRRRHGIDGVPDEVEGFFRRILDPRTESFIGMRAAVAHGLPQIAHIDMDWATSLLSDLFPDRAAWPDHWDAAWDAYVRHATPLPPEPVLRAMEVHYASAVELIDADHDVRHRGDPVVHLGLHLVFMFLYGTIDLEHQNLVTFFERAPVRVRPRVLDWMGRTAADNDLSDEWFVRAMAFFEWRERHVEKDGLDRVELRKLGWFVAAGRFPVAWWAPRLASALRKSSGPSYDEFVPLDDMMAEVAKACEEHPAVALDVLELVVDEDKRRWHEPYLGSAEAILTRTHEHPNLRHRARAMAERLARRGHEQFERFSSATQPPSP